MYDIYLVHNAILVAQKLIVGLPENKTETDFIITSNESCVLFWRQRRIPANELRGHDQRVLFFSSLKPDT